MGCEFSNIGHTQTEPLFSVKQMKEQYLFGLPLVDPASGQPFSDESIQTQINAAISWLEHDLEIAITPRVCIEEKDHYPNDYAEWGYFQLNHFPVIQINSIKAAYQRDSTGATVSAIEIPKEWIRLDARGGIIRLVPTGPIPPGLQFNSNYATWAYHSRSSIPQLWQIEYQHGFKEGCVPSLLNMAIGILGSLNTISVLGNIALGAGVVGYSIGLDGMSQSVQLSASAEYSAFSSLGKELRAQFQGSAQNDPNSIIAILRRYYKGQTMQVV